MNDLYWMCMEGHFSQYARSASRAQPFCLLEFGVLSLLGPGSWNFNPDQGGSGGAILTAVVYLIIHDY